MESDDWPQKTPPMERTDSSQERFIWAEKMDCMACVSAGFVRPEVTVFPGFAERSAGFDATMRWLKHQPKETSA